MDNLQSVQAFAARVRHRISRTLQGELKRCAACPFAGRVEDCLSDEAGQAFSDYHAAHTDDAAEARAALLEFEASGADAVPLKDVL